MAETELSVRSRRGFDRRIPYHDALRNEVGPGPRSTRVIIMASQLQDRISKVLASRWQAGERAIASQDVYEDLIHAGVEVPEDAMDAVFEQMEGRGLIHSRGLLDSHGTKQHGARVITRVSARVR